MISEPIAVGARAAGVAAIGCWAVLAATGCSQSLVHARPGLGQLENQVDAIALLPPRLGFGKLAEQRRAGREGGDFVIEATGGRAILADELPGIDPEPVVAGIRALGEDPRRTLIFSISATRGSRAEETVIPGAKGTPPIRRYSDYAVRLDIRSAETNEILGSVETFASAYASSPEIDSRGRITGLAQALREAIGEAVRKFAPRLVQPPGAARLATLIEAPRRGREDDRPGPMPDGERLRKLKVLYPEVPEGDLALLASSTARFLVLAPNGMSAMGLQAHDLISATTGRDLGSRASFARMVARGNTPPLSVERAGSRFVSAEAHAVQLTRRPRTSGLGPPAS